MFAADHVHHTIAFSSVFDFEAIHQSRAFTAFYHGTLMTEGLLSARISIPFANGVTIEKVKRRR